MSGFISNLWSDLSGPVSETIEEGKEYGKQGIRLLRWVWMPFVSYNISVRDYAFSTNALEWFLVDYTE